jgi:hypothetical protein
MGAAPNTAFGVKFWTRRLRRHVPRSLRRGQTKKRELPYSFLRRSVARSCSSASRFQICAISKSEALLSLPAGKLFAIL